jgi:hypothetical protein
MGVYNSEAPQSASRSPHITELWNHDLGIISNDDRLNLTGPMYKYAKLSVQLNRELTECPGHFRIDDFVALNPLLT